MADVTAPRSFGLNESNIFLKKYRSVELKPLPLRSGLLLLLPPGGFKTDHSAWEVPKKVKKTSSDNLGSDKNDKHSIKNGGFSKNIVSWPPTRGIKFLKI